jgi:sugar phosphate isomerase/epimerase
MRLAISNIAWDVSEDMLVTQLLKKYYIDAIDIAPGKYFTDPLNASTQDIFRVREIWEMQGIEITGMQALLFGTTGLNMFGPAPIQEAMFKHLEAVCRIAKGLGATRLVFGSPKNRNRLGLSDEEALAIAVPFFKQAGEIAQSHGVVICLEPNPPCYGANFMITTEETANVVKKVAHPAIKMQLDIGALTINGEDVAVVLKQHAHLIGHIHASEPDLVPLSDGKADHAYAHAVLAKTLPNHIVSIEMLATQNEPHPLSIERALIAAIRSYRD